jgi:Arc/MetJ-type ribon-helix-helix transcriptional regulator
MVFRLKHGICLAHLPRVSYDGAVKTLTIRLPDSLAAQIEQESRARRVSKSDVVRERLRQPQPVPAGSSMKDLIGDILEQSWTAKVPAAPRRFNSAKKQKLAEIIRGKKLRH